MSPPNRPPRPTAFVSATPLLSSRPRMWLPSIYPRMTVSTASPSDESFVLPRRVSRSVVWFRPGDLRTEDHAGLDAACSHTADALAPLLVLTPRSTNADIAAAKRLGAQLQARGSVLVLRFADDEATGVVQFLKDYRAERVHVRMDAEHEARLVVSRVERLVDGMASVQVWTSDLREWDDQDPKFFGSLPDEFPSFLRWSARWKAQIVPSAGDFQPEVILPGPGLDEADMTVEEVAEKVFESARGLDRRGRFERRVKDDFKFVRGLEIDPEQDKYGEIAVKEYLLQSDAYTHPDLGRTLSEVFRQGALSPRRIYEIVHEHERANGRIWRFFYREGAKMILDFLEAREFATLMARRDTALKQTVDGDHEAKFWRWNGFLVRYVEEGVANAGQPDKPPLLLVHGFGASSQHYGRSMRKLKEKYHVFAVDMIGFGRSEKPPMQYTQELWEQMLWDFVKQVVQRPVYVAGNSIGGYFSAAFASDGYGEVCAGVCLINSSGRLEDDPSARVRDVPASTRRGPFKYIMEESRTARLLAGEALLRSLRGRIQKTLQAVYPTNPAAADEQLAYNIRRDSLDYGAVEVLASGVILPPPRSLTELLQEYDGPLLVFQGVLDPLNDARGRANKIEAQYPRATVVRVNSGHCPHEEDAEAFVDAISRWMDVSNGHETAGDGESASRRAEVAASAGS